MVVEADLDDVITSDSAGTSAYHVGQQPDVRAQLTCRKRGYNIADHHARQITAEDFEKITVSSGTRGAQLLISVKELLPFVEATVADLTEDA